MRRMSGVPDVQQALTLFEEILAQSPVVKPRLVDKPVMLYGAGNLGLMAKVYFDRIGIDIVGVVDANADNYRGYPSWQGISVFAPDDVTSERRRQMLLAVCIATLPFTDLAEQLIESGWCDVVMFYDIAEAYLESHPLGNGWFSGPLDQQDRDQICHVLQRWPDDVSRAHHLQFLAYRCLRQDWVFSDAPVTQHDRYFIPDVKAVLHEREVFVDVGAHYGEIIQRFLLEVGSRYEKIWLIEPDEDNLRSAESALTMLEIGKLKVIRKVIADFQGPCGFFSGLGYASQLCDYADPAFEATTLDMLNTQASFIKLHIEGGELSALQGAQHTIANRRPILTATSYHNRNGLWTLPRWLLDNLVDYRIILRLHSWCGTGAVLYAIPEERSHSV
jgi:FkbM family methyltransferase